MIAAIQVSYQGAAIVFIVGLVLGFIVGVQTAKNDDSAGGGGRE